MHEHYLELGGEGPLLHLAPANGFPPETYRPLASALAGRFRVLGYRPRPLWAAGAPDIGAWRELAHDMLDDLEGVADGPVLGVGHSLGGILTLYCALLQPALFRGVVLIEPVILPRSTLTLLWLGRHFGLHRRHPLAAGAARRRERFADRDEARARYRGRGVFAEFVPEALDGYVEGALRDDEQGGVALTWPRAWEAHIFSLVPTDSWDTIRRLRAPLLLVRGRRSDLLVDRSWNELRRWLPEARMVELEGGHMLPMERPDEVAETVLRWAETL